MREFWQSLPRSGRIGIGVALAAAALLGPFLMYAGIAVMNAAAQFAQPVVGEGASITVAILAFALYVGLLVSVVSLVGASAGLLVGFVRRRASGRGA